jgi:hypothetical protein
MLIPPILNQAAGKILKSKKWIWTVGVLVLVALGFTVFNLFFFSPWLSGKLVRTVAKQSQGRYTLQMGDLSASLLTGSLTIDRISLVPDLALWEKRREKEKVPALLVNLKARQLHLDGINYIGLLWQKTIKLDGIKLTQPEVGITRMREASGAREALHRQLKGRLAGLEVKKIQAVNGNITYKSSHKDKWNTVELSGVNLEVADVQIDSAAFKDRQRVFYTKAIAFTAGRTNLLLPDGNYRLKTGRTAISTDAREIKISNVALVPLYQPQEMARRKGEATTWLAIKVPAVAVRGLDFPGFAHGSNLVIGSVQVLNPAISAYKDRKNFIQKGLKPLPHDLMQDLKTRLTIRELLVKDMHVRYEVLAPEATKTGFITFEKLNASIKNITNDNNLISAKTPAVIEVRTAIMGKAPLKATIRLNLLDPGGFHTITGWVGETDAGILNTILAPTSFVSIKSGVLKQSNFQIRLTREKASGTMRAHYTGLEMELLSKDKDKRQSLGKRLLSALANNTVVESDNAPEIDGEWRVGKITVTRKKNRSVFSYWKDCLASGLLSSAGLENIAEKK